MPKPEPRFWCARYASARPLAGPPASKSCLGISTVVMKLVVIRNTLMISAAVVSSFLVSRIRPVGFASVSSGSPSTSGITATPVSKPDMPSASLGKISSETPIITKTLPRSAVSPCVQSVTRCAAVSTCHSPFATTTTLSAR